MRPDDEALDSMRQLGGTWAAYQNVALDSFGAGHLQFLKIGDGCSYQTPPEKFPYDTKAGTGWKYRFVGMVNLETGEVEEKPHGG